MDGWMYLVRPRAAWIIPVKSVAVKMRARYCSL